MSILSSGVWLLFEICVPCWLLSTGICMSGVGTVLLAGCCRDKNGLVVAIYSVCSVSDNVIGDGNRLVNLSCLNTVGSTVFKNCS